MGAWERLRFRFGEFKKHLWKRHDRGWHGVSILIFTGGDEAGGPRSRRINNYVLFFFILLIVSLPLFSLILYIQERAVALQGPRVIYQDRMAMVNTLRLVLKEKEALLEEALVGVKAIDTLRAEERDILLRYLIPAEAPGARGEGSEQGGNPQAAGLDLPRGMRRKAVHLKEFSERSLNRLRNRVRLYHHMPRNRPLKPGLGYITSTFGNRDNPTDNQAQNDEFHGAYDIAVRTGEEIIATGPGIVTLASTQFPRKGYGYYIELHHGMGLKTLYAHCKELLVKEGDLVRRGQVIAIVGRTGRTTGSHVHYEVRLGVERINPLPFMQLK